MAESDTSDNAPATGATPEADNPEKTFPEEGVTSPADSSSADTGINGTGQDEIVDLGQKIVDISLGAVVLTGELTVQAARLIAEHGPEFLDTLEKKGRPVREQIDDWLKNAFTSPFQEAARTDKSEEAKSTAETSADDDISALERRVRELEAQVAQSVPSIPPVPPSPVAPDLDDGPVNAEGADSIDRNGSATSAPENNANNSGNSDS